MYDRRNRKVLKTESNAAEVHVSWADASHVSTVDRKCGVREVELFRQRAANSWVLKISILPLKFPKLGFSVAIFAFLDENYRIEKFSTIFPMAAENLGGNCPTLPRSY